MRLFFRAVSMVMLLTISLMTIGSGGQASAADKKTFKVGYVVYIGFMPYAWMNESGLIKKWGDKYGIKIELVQVNDYVGSINQFIGGDLDAVAVAGMDGLTMPAAGGVDTSMILLNDYSNGNDVILSKKNKTIPELKGETVYLVEYTVSHYMLQRALTIAGLPGLASVKTVNVSDADIASAYLTTADIQNVASWKPMTDDMIKGHPGTNVLFDSSKIPGEIMDCLITKTATVKEHPEFAKALIGAYYEAQADWLKGDETSKKMVKSMAQAMGGDVSALDAQVKTTHFFHTPESAYEFMTAAKTKETWDLIRTFSFQQGLFGQGASSVDAIGIAFPDGSVLGDKGNVKFRIDPTFTKMAVDGKL